MNICIKEIQQNIFNEIIYNFFAGKPKPTAVDVMNIILENEEQSVSAEPLGATASPYVETSADQNTCSMDVDIPEEKDNENCKFTGSIV